MAIENMCPWRHRLRFILCLLTLGAFSSTFGAWQAVPAERQASQIAVLPIRGAIDDITALSLARRVEIARQRGATAIVLEIDTPGGDVVATLRICHMIKQEFPPNTVAWIHPRAFSAGTIIALASREIVVSPGSSFGDAAPIQAIPGAGLIPLPATERAKLEAPLIAEVVDSARARGYDEHLVTAFVRLGGSLWLIRSVEDDRTALVDEEEYHDLFGEAPPKAALAEVPDVPPTEVDGSVAQQLLPMFSNRSQSKTPEPTEQADKSDEVDPDTEPRLSRARLTAVERANWTLVEQVTRPDQLLVLYPREAIELGLARGIVGNDAELARWFGATKIERLEESWSESLTRFLVSWPIRIVLIVLMLVGFVIEGFTPGFGFFGGVAAVSLLLLVGAPALVGLADWWELIAVVLGLALVALDIIVLPTGGWVAVIGGAILLGGLVSSFVTRDLSTAVGQQQMFFGIGSVLVSLFGSAAILWFAARSLPQSPLLLRAVLQSETAAGSAQPRVSKHVPMVGENAVAMTTLRPSGRISCGGKLLDACTTGEFVDAGSLVRVVGVRGGTIEVEPTMPPVPSTQPHPSSNRETQA